MIVAALVLASCAPKTDKAADAAAAAAAADSLAAVEAAAPKALRLNVFVNTTPENLTEVVAGLNELATASRAEAGCEGYDIYQSTIEPTKIVIVETWADEASLTAHQQTPHYTTILPALDGKMSFTSNERFEF